MKPVLFSLMLASVLFAADAPRVTRESMAALERRMDGAIRGMNITEPYDLLGFTRGVYLPGYGVVFSTEINLVITIVSPFNPEPAGNALLQLEDKKKQRLAFMRTWMREQLVNAGAALDQVPPNERIVYAMTLFYQSFEKDHPGMPNQIVVAAPRQALADFKFKRITKAQLDAAIQAWEL